MADGLRLQPRNSIFRTLRSTTSVCVLITELCSQTSMTRDLDVALQAPFNSRDLENWRCPPPDVPVNRVGGVGLVDEEEQQSTIRGYTQFACFSRAQHHRVSIRNICCLPEHASFTRPVSLPPLPTAYFCHRHFNLSFSRSPVGRSRMGGLDVRAEGCDALKRPQWPLKRSHHTTNLTCRNVEIQNPIASRSWPPTAASFLCLASSQPSGFYCYL